MRELIVFGGNFGGISTWTERDIEYLVLIEEFCGSLRKKIVEINL